MAVFGFRRDDARLGGFGGIGAELVQVHGAAHACGRVVGFARDGEQLAPGDRQNSFGAVRCEQQLLEGGCGRVLHVVDRNEVGTLGSNEGVAHAFDFSHGEPFNLGTLFAGALFVVKTVLVCDFLDRIAGIPHDGALGVEDGPASRAALPVAFVCGGNVLVIDPRNRVGFARNSSERFGRLDIAVLLHVDAVEVHRAGGEHARDLVRVEIDNRDAVVLLERDGELVLRVDRHVLGLEVLGGVEAGLLHDVENFTVAVREAHGGGRPGRGIAIEIELECLHEARRHLRQTTLSFLALFIALVLDRDCGDRAILVDSDRVGLAFEVDRGDLFPRADLEYVDASLRLREVPTRLVDHHEHVIPGDGNRGGLVVAVARLGERNAASSLGGVRVGDVEEPDALTRGIGVDEGVAVFTHGRNFGDGFIRGINPFGGILIHRVRRGACEGAFDVLVTLGESGDSKAEAERAHEGTCRED